MWWAHLISILGILLHSLKQLRYPLANVMFSSQGSLAVMSMQTGHGCESHHLRWVMFQIGHPVKDQDVICDPVWESSGQALLAIVLYTWYMLAIPSNMDRSQKSVTWSTTECWPRFISGLDMGLLSWLAGWRWVNSLKGLPFGLIFGKNDLWTQFIITYRRWSIYMVHVAWC